MPRVSFLRHHAPPPSRRFLPPTRSNCASVIHRRKPVKWVEREEWNRKRRLTRRNNPTEKRQNDSLPINFNNAQVINHTRSN